MSRRARLVADHIGNMLSFIQLPDREIYAKKYSPGQIDKLLLKTDYLGAHRPDFETPNRVSEIIFRIR